MAPQRRVAGQACTRCTTTDRFRIVITAYNPHETNVGASGRGTAITENSTRLARFDDSPLCSRQPKAVASRAARDSIRSNHSVNTRCG